MAFAGHFHCHREFSPLVTFPCRVCGKSCASPAGLASHHRIVHQGHYFGARKKGEKLTGQALIEQRKHIAKAIAASPNYIKKGERVRFVCAYSECSNVFYRVPSRLKFGVAEPCCSKSCAAKHGKRVPPATDPVVQSARMKARFAADPSCNPFFGRTPENFNGWGYGGFVPELGFKIRSTWERDYLLAMQENGIEFTYEPERFHLGRFTYLPDVVIDDTNFYIEITGWDKPIKKLKRGLFLLQYDVRLYVVDKPPTDKNIADLLMVCKEVMP